MNAVEIEEAVSALAAAPYVRADFPFQFLAAFGFKETTINKLKVGNTNTSDVPDGILLRSNIHLATADPGKTTDAFAALKLSPKTIKGKAKMILATDGETIEAEDLVSGEPLSCNYAELANHFGFFLPLAGISTVEEIKDNPIDIRATGRLNKLYLELLKDNKDWATAEKRPALNQFMARLIFCFFAEDTGIFNHQGMFTACLKQMSEPSSSNTHEVIEELFRAMNTSPDARKSANLKRWAAEFPYVNGGLFADDIGCPKFSKIARSYLIRAGELDWKQINPDIFGSMIQAVADDDERGSLGMHYTSVPNILKVLDPLFLDDLREQLEEAGDNARKLLNLRKHIAAIRVFDPACGSGNFLVIAYQKMREIEAEIIKRRNDDDKKSWIKLISFYGIEIKTFPAEIARLALLISEFKANVTHIGQREACLDVLPLHETGKIVTGNALQLDWSTVCPPFSPLENERDHDLEIHTFICGNPPYFGSVKQSEAQKEDLHGLFGNASKAWKSLDYVAGWLIKAGRYGASSPIRFAFVVTKSICQGEQVPLLWPELYALDCDILYAYRAFHWSNLAANKAGVTVAIVGMTNQKAHEVTLYEVDDVGAVTARRVPTINAYLVPAQRVIVRPLSRPLDDRGVMIRGNMANDGGHLLMSRQDAEQLLQNERAHPFVRKLIGSAEFINGISRYCLWIDDAKLQDALKVPEIAQRIESVRKVRNGPDAGSQARSAVNSSHRFVFAPHQDGRAIIVPRVSSVNREYLPIGLISGGDIISDRAAVIYNGRLSSIALLASRLHQCWIAAVCVRMRMDYSYSNTLGWNTFPVPTLTENDKADLTHCAEAILLAREAHFPKTIADLYDPETMPADLRAAHDRNDETLERIYIGRRFRNDTERLEKLFDMYTKMTKDEGNGKTKKNGKSTGKGANA
jgi:hypothetical protein